MDKYTIIIPNGNELNTNCKTFDEVLTKSKQLCKDEVFHIIRDNEFGISINMAECCR